MVNSRIITTILQGKICASNFETSFDKKKCILFLGIVNYLVNAQGMYLILGVQAGAFNRLRKCL